MNDARTFATKVGINDRQIDYTRSTVESIPLTDGKGVFYNLSKTRKEFLGVEGKNGHVDSGSEVFKLKHNGIEIFNRGIMHQGDPPKSIDIEVKGGILELIVEEGGDGPSGDHAL
ncbi:MAG: hypothetical protein ACI9FN_001201 [Saprospiraceae bacterium]